MAFKGIGKLTLLLALLCIPPVAAARDNNPGQPDSLVRLMKASSLQLIDWHGRSYRKAVDATFLHSGTYLICDTALWNVDARIINAEGNVKLIQGDNELTSDNLQYFVDSNLAQFRGAVVQLRNKDGSMLRTMNLDYNTRDSTAVFYDGGSMRDAEGQVIESIEGTYNSEFKTFDFDRNVNMFTDSVFVKTRNIVYDGISGRVNFTTYVDFWKDDNMLSALGGWYERRNEKFFFNGDVHALSRDQEAWCDSMFYYRVPNDVELLGKAQVQDPGRRSTAVAGYISYRDSSSTLRLEKHAAVRMETEQDGRTDTLYFGADTLILNTVRMCDINDGEITAAKTRLGDIMADPVMEFRRKAAEEAAKAAAEAAKNDPNRPPEQAAKQAKALAEDESGREKSAAVAETVPEVVAGAPDSILPSADSTVAAIPDSLAAIPDSLAAIPDSLAAVHGSPDNLPDSIAAASDSLTAFADSTLSAADSLSQAVLDSIARANDTTKVNFVTGVGKVKVFRRDIQVLCDSMRYNGLDSIARFYIDPVIWNEGNRQYSSDSIFVLVRNAGVDRASLMSDAFIMTREDSLYFDQIKGTDVMAYFDSTSALRRFDALGGATAMFFLRENDVYATVNKVECKMLSALFANGELDRVFYFDSPKNDAYPLAQLTRSDLEYKGFNWRIKERPNGPSDITPIVVRESEREYYLERPGATFKQTERFFPGYMDEVYASIEASKLRREKAKRLRDSLAAAGSSLPDSVAVAPGDSLDAEEVTVADSLASAALAAVAATSESAGISVSGDTTGLADSLAPVIAISDTAAAASDSLHVSVAADSSAAAGVSNAAVAGVAASAATLSQQRAAERAARREEAERQRAARAAEREARWARLDSLDAAHAADKADRQLHKKRKYTLALYLKQLQQDAVDSAKLDKYIEYYQKKKAKDEERERKRRLRHKPVREVGLEQNSEPEPAGERTPGIEAGRDIPPADES